MKIFSPATNLLLATFIALTPACNEQRSETSEAEQPTEVTPNSPGDGELIEGEAQESVTVRVETPGNSIQDMHYNQEEIRVPANALVTVILVNKAKDPAMIHNIVFARKNNLEQLAKDALRAGTEQNYVPDMPAVFAGSELIQPGETTEFTFTAPFQSGEYAFVCTYPGHWQQMNGRFIVETEATME
jgi:azurin